MIPLAQISEQLWRLWLYLTHTRSLAMVLGVAFAILAVVLLIVSRTRWGQTKPLTKCVVLSILAHVWLLMYGLGTRTVLPQGNLSGSRASLAVAFEGELVPPAPPLLADSDVAADAELRSAADSDAGESEGQAADARRSELAASVRPWEQTAAVEQLPRPELLDKIWNQVASDALVAPSLLPTMQPTPLPPLPPMSESESESESAAEPPEAASTLADSAASPLADGLASAAPAVTPASSDVEPLTATAVLPPLETHTAIAPAAVGANSSWHSELPRPTPAAEQMPVEYQLRQSPQRAQLAAAYGADADSEAAVQHGLRWLARSQAEDGSWIARQHGAGTETYALGESRYGTGDKADTGISGLALLAFLSAGHTHLHGEFRTCVQGGLQYLLRAQMPSGDLSGPKQVGSDRGVLNARMYCHSIATLALAEAYAMTGDEVLREPLERAAHYSMNAQDPRGGGWRYRPLDAGDLSQFGWQAMALRSAQRAGVVVPAEVHVRMRRFLDACAAGDAGGLATYQPKNGRPSETMTAEGLACRLLLQYPLPPAAEQEALAMIMRHRPGTYEDNVYFWYYATLALFQLQDEQWRIWNQALKQHLLATQVPPYAPQPGSWNPDRMWGGYGGRVYSTAMSCLCLEVYYRYLPMYQSQVAGAPARVR